MNRPDSKCFSQSSDHESSLWRNRNNLRTGYRDNFVDQLQRRQIFVLSAHYAVVFSALSEKVTDDLAFSAVSEMTRAYPERMDGAGETRLSVGYANALDAVDRISTLNSLPDLMKDLERSLSTFGIDHFVITGLPNPHETFERVVVFHHWPEGWFETYSLGQYVRDDPVIRMCHSTTFPFEWSEAPFDSDREPKALQVMNRARDFGLKRGFSVPIHGANGYEACFSVSGLAPDFDSGVKPSLHLIAMYAFERARKLGLGGLEPVSPNPLTNREREVLTWAAVGKSHADIAQILSVTERTVTAHTVNATQKLGATNKTHAVVRAMQANFIRI